MIKYIIFDWGGVFTHGHFAKDFAENLSKKCGKSKGDIEGVFRETHLPYETGKIVPESFWEDFKKRLNIELAKEKIQRIFFNSYVLNPPMLELAKKLKKKFKLVLLTNNYEDLFDFMKTEYGLEKYFDYLFSSSGIKFRKPDKEIYEFIVKWLEINPSEAIFIDDKERNVIGAQKVGLHAILFEDIAKLKRILKTDYEII